MVSLKSTTSCGVRVRVRVGVRVRVRVRVGVKARVTCGTIPKCERSESSSTW